MNLLDPRFKYTPSTSTNIVSTWKRHGFKPTTEAERRARQRANGEVAQRPRSASITPLASAKRKLRALSLATPKTTAGSGQR